MKSPVMSAVSSTRSIPRHPVRRRAHSLLLAGALAATAVAGTATAATYTWDPVKNTTGSAGSGNWDTVVTNNIWANAGADVVWPNTGTDVAIFGGAAGTYAVTVASGITAGSATFNTSGYTLGSAAATTLALSSATNPLNVAAGVTANIGANLTVSVPGGAMMNSGAPTNTGTLNIGSGGTLSGGLFYVAAGTLNVGSGGTLTISNSLAVGNDSTRTGSLTVNGGAVTVTNSLVIGGNSGSINPVVSLNSGTITVTGSPGVRFGSGSIVTNATFNLNGGTLSVTSLGNSMPTGPTSTFNFNGGTLQSRSSTYGATFFSQTGNAVNNLVVQTGGAKIDTNTFNMTITPSLVHDAALGATPDGGLNKLSTGTLTLAAANTYTGGTTVTGGILAATANGALGAGNVTVASTAISLTLTGTTDAISNTASLTLAGGGAAGVADNGYLNLGTSTETVGTLTLGATTYTSGVFTAATFPEYFSGAGVLTVGAVPEPQTWAVFGFGCLGTLIVTLRRRLARA